MSKTKAELEARVVELEAELQAAGARPQPEPDIPFETDPRRDVAEVAREMRGE